MSVRHGDAQDREAVRELWETWQAELPAPAWADGSWAANEAEIDRGIDANGLFLAEEDGRAVGFVTSWINGQVAWIGDLYVTADARRRAWGASSSRPSRRIFARA